MARKPIGLLPQWCPLSPGWVLRVWPEGLQQVAPPERVIGEHVDLLKFCIERVIAPKSRRKQWTVVHRRQDTDKQLYGPKAAGPFKTIEGAQAAYLVLISSN